MIGDAAQIITIASYGNEFLNNGLERLDCRNHSSFRSIGGPVYKNDFDDYLKRLDTNQWYKRLMEQGCNQIRIFYNVVDPTKDGVQINESISWVLETVFNGYSDFWTYHLRHGSSGWWVKIEKSACHQSIINKQEDLVLRKNDLGQKLEVMIDYAGKIGWVNWARHFGYMRNILFNDIPTLPDFHKDLIVEKNYSLLARQVLYSAVSSWCFTGMGSWSDNGVFSEEEYIIKERITSDLFFSVCDSFVAAINSY